MDSNLHCADLATHHFCDLLVLHLLVTAEHQNFSFFFRQLIHRALEDLGMLLLFQFLGWKYRPALDEIDGILRQGSFALMFPEMIESRIAGDVKHPCLEPTVVPKGFAILQHPEKDVLNEVLRDCPAADHPGKEVEQS